LLEGQEELSAVNTDELEHALFEAERRVLKIQTKLHRWARDDPRRRFDDLFNLVADPGFLLVAWDRVAGNKGARTAGIDGRTARSVEAVKGSRSSSTDCGRACRTAVSVRCRCASG
jgi:retron-type reverse transcriptase